MAIRYEMPREIADRAAEFVFKEVLKYLTFNDNSDSGVSRLILQSLCSSRQLTVAEVLLKVYLLLDS